MNDARVATPSLKQTAQVLDLPTGFPNTPLSIEERARRRVRLRELAVASVQLRKFLPRTLSVTGDSPRILEVGTGNGFQQPQLQRMGFVVASDVLPPSTPACFGARFVVSDITRAPFARGSFDVVYSSCVLQSLGDLGKALTEMARVCTANGLIVAVVPGRAWLWLGLPLQYVDKIRHMLSRVRKRIRKHTSSYVSAESAAEATRGAANPDVKASIIRRLLPKGYGRYPAFWAFHHNCGKRGWRRHFVAAGLRVVYEETLLLYAPSGLPFLPPNRLLARIGISSSLLFILRSESIAASPSQEPAL